MNFLSRSPSSHLRRCHRHHFLQLRSLYDGVSTLKWPRDRGLDHAVERDKLLKPLLNLKNLIISEPSKSIPLTLITESKETLGIPFRPIEFIRKYPSIFEEFQPGSLNILPHIKLTPNIISLNSEENLLYQSVNYKQGVASRLLKLLMISRVNTIPIYVLERLKWELGLPLDYEKALIPEFPDYFRVIGEHEKLLELVCWSDDFAVSEMEKKGEKSGKTEFLLKFSNEFEMDKKYKKWLDEWQKLPYLSPYDNAMHLGTKTDESDKWVVAVLHEVLNLFVGKKAERENLLCLGEYLGLRPSFKRAFLQHPGIFYVSSKIGTHTVVLREAYKRGMLIERHPLIAVRSNYIKLMNVMKADNKPQQKSGKSEGGEVVDAEEGSDDYESSDEDESDDSMEVVEVKNVTKTVRPDRRNIRDAGKTKNGRGAEEIELKSSKRSSRRRNVGPDDMDDSSDEDESDDCGEVVEAENVNKRGRREMKGRESERRNTRGVGRRTNGEDAEDIVLKSSTRSSRRANARRGATYDSSDDDESDGYEEATKVQNMAKRGRQETRGGDFERRDTRGEGRRTNGRGTEENVSRSSTRSSRRTNVQGGEMFGDNKSEGNEKRGRSEMRGRDFERRDTRSPGRRTNGRGFEENMPNSSTRSSRGTHFRGGEMFGDSKGDGYGKRGRNEMKGRDFERRDTRSPGRRTNGRGFEENVSNSSTRSSRGTNFRGGEMFGNSKSDGYGKRGRNEMKGRDFERRDTRSPGRRTNGRGFEENESNNSTRSSRGTNFRGGDSNGPRGFTRNSGFPGSRDRSETGRAST